MKKLKFILPAAAALICAPAVYAKVTVTNTSAPGATYTIQQSSMGETGEAAPQSVTLDAKGSASFSQQAGPTEISIYDSADKRVAQLFSTSPDEDLTVTIAADGTARYAGSRLMNDLQMFFDRTAPLQTLASTLPALYDTDPKEAEARYEEINAKYAETCKSFLASYPDSPAAPYALLNLDGQNFMDGYTALTPQARQSIFMFAVEKAKSRNAQRMEAEKRMAEMESGTVPAPAFSLPDLNGKTVSLADFKGKWVILDFWGSWCRWCVKGFPELKDIYSKYSGKLEVIGIDCNETADKWKAAVAKYELPWINLYYDTEKDMSLLNAYAVQGFPTKVVVGPDGMIRKIVVGADPSFPETLDKLLNGK